MQNIEYKVSQLKKIGWEIQKRIISENNSEYVYSQSHDFQIKLTIQPDQIDRIRIGNINIPKVRIQLLFGIPQPNTAYDREFDLIKKDEFLNQDQDKLNEKILDIDCEKKVNYAIFTFQNPYHQEKDEILMFFYILLEKKGPDQYDKKLLEKNKIPTNYNQFKKLSINIQPQQTFKKELQLKKIEKANETNKITLKVTEGGGGYNSIVNNLKNSPTSNKKEDQKYYQYKNTLQLGSNVIQQQPSGKLYQDNKPQRSLLYYKFSNKEDEDFQKAIEMSKKDQINKENEKKKKTLENKDNSYDSIDTQFIKDDSDSDNKCKNKKDSSTDLQNKNNLNNEFKQSENKNTEKDQYDADILKAIELSKLEQEQVEKNKKKKENQETEDKKIKESSTQQMEEEVKDMKQKSKDQTDVQMQAQNQQSNQQSEKKPNYLMKLSRRNLKIQNNADSLSESDSFSFSKEENNSNQNKASNQTSHNNSNQINQSNSKNVMDVETIKDDIESNQSLDEKYLKYLQSRDLEDFDNVNGKSKHIIIESATKNNQSSNIWNRNDNKMEIENSDINHKQENMQDTDKLESFKQKSNTEKVFLQTTLFDKNKLNRLDNSEHTNILSNRQRVSININNKNSSNNYQQQSNNLSLLQSHFQLEPHNLSDRILKFQRQQELKRKIPEKYYLFQPGLKDILRDKIITISGYEGDMRDQIKQLINDLGGTYQPDMNELTNYMITKDKKTDKYNQYLRNKDLFKNLKVVDKKFLQMCKCNKKLIDCQAYLIQ
ncbi:hypothetical protein ABPG72_014158 [Tetrahymena utriculariae]